MDTLCTSPISERTAQLCRDRGHEILDRVLRCWRQTRETGVPNPLAPGSALPWHPLSLEAGDLGLALIYASAEQLDPDGGWDEHAHPHVAAAVAEFRTMPDLGIGLFSGTAGVALALASLSRRGTRYTGALATVEDILCRRAQDVLSGLDPEAGVASDDYDMINGLAGVAWYLLHRGPDGLGLVDDVHEGPQGAMLSSIVHELARRSLSLPAPDRGLATGAHQITEVERTFYPHLARGYVNLGFAHGIAGPLAVLGEARHLGWTGLDEPIAVLRAVLGSSLTERPYGPDTGYYLGTADTAQGPTRSAWCYGNPGLAIAASASGAPGQDGLLPPAAELLSSSLSRPVSEMQIDNPSLCHGYGGLVIIGRALGCPTDAAVEHLLEMWDPSRAYGLRVQHTPHHVVDSPGLLEGSGGAAIALLTAGSAPGVTTPIQIQLAGRSHRACRP